VITYSNRSFNQVMNLGSVEIILLLVRGYWLAVNVASTSQFCWRRGGFATVAGWRERSHPPTQMLQNLLSLV